MTIELDIHKGEIAILLITYNEEDLIEHAYNYYKKRFPMCKFIVLDNGSTDNTVKIAEKLNCEVIRWHNKTDKMKESDLVRAKSTYWKEYKGWVISADIDEWLDIDVKMLQAEDKKGNTLIKTKGVQIMGNSTKDDLSDIKSVEDEMNMGYFHDQYDKLICFKSGQINSVSYGLGCHKASFKGNVKSSTTLYYLRHYSILGKDYYYKKIYRRHMRSLGYKDQKDVDKYWKMNNSHKLTDFKNVWKT